MKKMIPEEWALAILIMVMVLMVVAQILSRYLFHTSLSHTEELVRYLFVWATFLGAAGAAYRKRHLSISAGLNFLPEHTRKTVKVITFVCALVFAGLILLYGVRVVFLQWATGQMTAALGIPMWIVGLAVPFGALLLILRLFMMAREKGESLK
ncbi:MAG: TRAP transporter small permease [Candidatus Latescibacterota bacterium]